MNNLKKIALLGAAFCLTMVSCNMQKSEDASAGYIGTSQIKVENGLMSPEVMLNLGRLSDPQLSPDGKTILYGVSYTSIEENRSCRNLFLASPDGKDIRQLTREGKSISNARFSNDGRSIYYIQGGQVYKAAFDGTKLSGAKKLTDIEAGIGEFKLSPDESMILFTSTVPGSVKTPKDIDPELDKAQAYVTEDLMYRHWDHWTTERPQTYIAPLGNELITDSNTINILGKDAGRYELPLEPFGGAEQLCWSPDSKHIAYSCKKVATGKEYAFSTNTGIYVFDITTEETTAITESGGYDTDPVWSPDGSRIAWLSMARNGYEADKTRLMVAELSENMTASSVKDLTASFKYNAASPVWSEDSEKLYFCALAEGLEALYKVTPDGSGAVPARITPEDAWYDFGGIFGFAEGRLLASYQSMEFPTELVAVNEADGSFNQITRENNHILDQLKPFRTEQKWLETVDGQKMLTWVLYPPEFDSTKVYPAIEIFLGGPQGTLSQGWSYRWNYRLMCNQGYVVVLPNRRGTTAFGQEWCEQISGDYIGLNMQDYLTAANYIKSKPYIGKLAGCGASYGGFSVYYMAGIHGNTYDCFIAHAGIFDEKYMYGETEEMWFPNWDNGGLEEYSYTPGETGPRGDGVTFGGMKQAGSPWSSSPKTRRHYANSPDMNVTKWHTPILCIHGMMDYRIPYDQGMQAFNCAQMMGVPSKLVVFPEENHWILRPQNAMFWHKEYFDWLERWCKTNK